MAKVTADQFAEKYANNTKGAVEDYRNGVNNVSEAPGKKAAQQADKWQQKLSSQETKNKFKERVGAVSLSEWQQKAGEVGAGRIPAGVDGARNLMQEFANQFLPHVDSGKKKVQELPDLTIEDSINRATTMIKHNAQFRFKRQ